MSIHYILTINLNRRQLVHTVGQNVDIWHWSFFRRFWKLYTGFEEILHCSIFSISIIPSLAVFTKSYFHDFSQFYCTLNTANFQTICKTGNQKTAQAYMLMVGQHTVDLPFWRSDLGLLTFCHSSKEKERRRCSV